MIVTLRFKLPDERYEYHQAMRGEAYLRCLEDMRDYLRERLKYTELNDEESRIYAEVEDKLYEILSGHEVRAWDEGIAA